MKKIKICVVVYNLTETNRKLQPWRYLLELFNTIDNKYEIHFLTNSTFKNELFPYKIHSDIKISPYKNKKLIKTIKAINPEIIFWWASKKTFLYKKVFKILNKNIILYYTGPIYYFKSEIFPVLKYISLKDIYHYVIDSLIPLRFLKNLINSSVINKTVVMTKRNYERFIQAGTDPEKVIIIPQGYSARSLTRFYSHDISFKSTASIVDKITILYMGRATPLRGVEFLIRSFGELLKRIPSSKRVSLHVLSRDSDENYIRKLKLLVNSLALEPYINIENGWLERDNLELYMYESRFLVMPFLLVPSEIPISILEYLSLGKPVIAPDLDGIPELLESGCGIVYKHYDQDALTDAMFKLIMDDELYNKLCKNSRAFINNYYTWDSLKIKLSKILL